MSEAYVDNLMYRAGNNNKYQIVLVVTAFLLVGSTEFFSIILPFIQVMPYASWQSFDLSNNEGYLDFSICESSQNIVIIEEKSSLSLVLDFGIYCNRTYTVLLGVVLYSGVFVGSLLNYRIIEKFGRRKTIMTSIVVYVCICVAYQFNRNLPLLYIFLGLNGLTSSTIVNSTNILVSELIRKEMLAINMCIIYCSSFYFGIISALLFSYNLLNWNRIFIGMAAIDIICFFMFLKYFRDSPRYYMLKNDFLKFRGALQKICIKNGKPLFNILVAEYEAFTGEQVTTSIKADSCIKNESLLMEERTSDILSEHNGLKAEHSKTRILLDDVKSSIDRKLTLLPANNDINSINRTFDAHSHVSRRTLITSNTIEFNSRFYTVIDLLKFKSQRGNFIILTFLWLISSTVYYAFNLNLKAFNEAIYFNSILLFSFDHYFVTTIGFITNTKMFGRKLTIMVLFGVSLISLIFSFYYRIGNEKTKTDSIHLIIRECSLCVMVIVSYLSNEIFPTTVRSVALSFNSGAGKIGMIIAPILTDLFSNDILIFGSGFAVISIGLIITGFIPETYGKPINEFVPEETEDYDDNYQDNYFDN